MKENEMQCQMVPRMRTIEQAAAIIKEIDPDSALTKTALRRLVTTGKIESVRIGTKYLINLDSLISYLGSC